MLDIPNIERQIEKIKREMDTILELLPFDLKLTMKLCVDTTLEISRPSLHAGANWFEKQCAMNNFSIMQCMMFSLLEKLYVAALECPAIFTDSMQVQLGIFFVKTRRWLENKPYIMQYFSDSIMITATQFEEARADLDVATAILLGIESNTGCALLKAQCTCCGLSSSKKCSCNAVVYCSKACQVADWRVHKKKCTYKSK